jgi:hypothetical protein
MTGKTNPPEPAAEISVGAFAVRAFQHAQGCPAPRHRAIGSVARTDFLGGDAGELHDPLRRILEDLDDDTLLYPGHVYQGRERSTVGEERAGNPYLSMERAEFVRQLMRDPPPRPANMDDLLRLNRSGEDIPLALSAADAVERVQAGGAASAARAFLSPGAVGAAFPGAWAPGACARRHGRDNLPSSHGFDRS